MCIEPEAFVQAKVVTRLIEAGVSEKRALAVGAKVRRRYARARNLRLAAIREADARARESDLRLVQAMRDGADGAA